MSRTIMVVEDDSEHRYFFSRVLESAGYDTVNCESGEEGISKAFASPPDLVIMDLVLPSLGGWEAAHTLKADDRTKHVPIFAVTAYPHMASDPWLRDAACDACLTKPVEPRRLLNEVERWIGPGKKAVPQHKQ